jgi:hypothetical protein
VSLAKTLEKWLFSELTVYQKSALLNIEFSCCWIKVLLELIFILHRFTWLEEPQQGKSVFNELLLLIPIVLQREQDYTNDMS